MSNKDTGENMDLLYLKEQEAECHPSPYSSHQTPTLVSTLQSINDSRLAEPLGWPTYSNSPVGSMSASTFNCSFVGFRSTVAKKDLFGVGISAQPIGEGGLLWNKVEVGNVMDLVHLIGDGSRQFFIRMTKGTGGNTTDAIQIILSIGSEEMASLSVANGQCITTVNKRSNNVDVRKANQSFEIP